MEREREGEKELIKKIVFMIGKASLPQFLSQDLSQILSQSRQRENAEIDFWWQNISLTMVGR